MKTGEKMNKKVSMALIGLAAAGVASAANVSVSSDITTSTTWTSDNVYNLTDQVYVQPGATLTVQAGTLVQSTSGGGGSLAVCRGAKIYVNGTKDAPVIMTSTDDTLTGWHEGCNEWGNLTLMGSGLISASHYKGNVVSRFDGSDNTKTPTGLNEKQMEGLTGGSETYYGGANDDDDSGSISYLSLRYGGKVIGLANELNGMSLGAIGRETDIHHVEIMNNVDDGIEIWGGAVNLKYINIWNIGDDSFDVDEGWRGKAQFGLIVQGYSTDDSQGSGVGDNCFEVDGAEDSDAQPVTTTKIANFTVVGNPLSGDNATEWRDNARVQYHNCIFMDIGEQLVKGNKDDGDGASGYGYNGTLSWADTWTTSYDTYSSVSWSTDVYSDPADMYPVQSSGFLAEMKNSVFYNIYGDGSDGFSGADAVGVRDAANNNVTASALPIVSMERAGYAIRGGKAVQLVTNINPCAANDAVTAAATGADDFYVAAPFSGGFSADYNWLEGWTAVDAYGMTDTSMNGDSPTAAIDTGVVISFQSEFGVEYTVERTENDVAGPWEVAMKVIGDGSYMTFGDANLSSAGFYRVVSN
jgi:hypothetical protein